MTFFWLCTSELEIDRKGQNFCFGRKFHLKNLKKTIRQFQQKIKISRNYLFLQKEESGLNQYLGVPLFTCCSFLRYSTWNLAFVSNYPDFPFYMAKLLIPTVSGYHGNPERFLYPRHSSL